MIIKCPKCKKVFLAPDDLEEGQELKCGNCGYSWILKQDIKEIPKNIKPAESDHSDDFNVAPKEKSLFKTVFMAVAVTAIICFGAIHYRMEIVRACEPSAKIFRMLNINIPAAGDGLELYNVRAKERNDVIYLAGNIMNNSSSKKIVPEIIVGGSVVVRADLTELPPKESTYFQAILPGDAKRPISVTFK